MVSEGASPGGTGDRLSGGVPAVAIVEAGVEAEVESSDLMKGDLRAEAGSLARGSAECWRFSWGTYS